MESFLKKLVSLLEPEGYIELAGTTDTYLKAHATAMCEDAQQEQSKAEDGELMWGH